MTRVADSELARIHDAVEHKVLVDGRGDVEGVLSTLARCEGHRTPKTLDLIGHSTPKGTLQLGDWVLDASSPTVTAFFRGLADDDVLPRLGVYAVRLLGCKTAETAQARSTICVLADILGLEVYGTTGLLYSAHYEKTGFSDGWSFLLTGASDLRRERSDAANVPAKTDPRCLDIDALPAVPLDDTRAAWPRHVATDRAARTILRLVRRDAGAQMPGLLAMPSCEIALPSGRDGFYHVAQVVLGGQFVRVYPDGWARDGVLYPVEQPDVLHSIVEQLAAS